MASKDTISMVIETLGLAGLAKTPDLSDETTRTGLKRTWLWVFEATPDDELLVAVKAYLAEGQFWPPPAAVRNLLPSREAAPARVAGRLWAQVMAAVQADDAKRLPPHGGSERQMVLDAIKAAAGGWWDLCHMHETRVGQVQRTFEAEIIRQLEDTKQEDRRLELTERQSQKLLIEVGPDFWTPIKWAKK